MKLKKSDKKVLLNDLCDLIAIDTSNPPGQELEAARFVQGRMAELGGECVLQEFATGRANAVCRFTFSDPAKGPCLVLNSHLDVVPPGKASWTYHPFKPELTHDRVYGRGACDAKGCLAAMMAAIRLIQASNQRLHGELILTAVAAEETGGLGTQYWLKNRTGDDRLTMAVVGEPSALEVLIGHRGVSRRKVIVHGRSAHSSLPSEGRNAIYPAAALATFIEKLNERLATHVHPLLGPGGVSATVIHGGIKDNVIPDRCELTIDRRRIPGEGPEKIDQEIEEWAQALLAVDSDLQYAVEVLGVDKEPVAISTDEGIFRIAAEAVREAAGKKPEPRGCIGASDMAFLVHRARIPTIIFGPGKMAQAHIVDEFVEIKELELAASIYAGIVQRALGGCSTYS